MNHCPQKEVDEVCGRPQFSTGSIYCEKHFSASYPITYRRLKREIQCPECSGQGFKVNIETERQNDCEVCEGRGWVDPTLTRPSKPEPEPETMRANEPQQVGKVMKKVFFDPPQEKTTSVKVDAETGEILTDHQPTMEEVGF